MTGTVLNMRSATLFRLRLYWGRLAFHALIPVRAPPPCLRSHFRCAGSGIGLPHLSVPIRYQPINLEVIQTRLDALACVRPFSLGHVRPRIPHPHAVGDVSVMHLLRG